MAVDLKRCARCREDLPVGAFGPDAGNADGLKCNCRPCTRAKTNERRESMRNAAAIAALDAETRAGLAAFGSEIERECVEALATHGDIAAAAASLDLTAALFRAHLSELRRRAAQRGWSPAHDMSRPTPEGYRVKGVSTYYKADPETGAMVARGQWVKTDRNADEKLAVLAEAVAGIAEPFRALAEPVPSALAFDDDLLAVYPMGDPHVGMYAWARETGEDFDLEIAERNLVAAVDHLVDLAPPARQALIIDLGDFFHADGPENRTARSGHALDVDTRWAKVLGIGIRAMRRNIDRALEKHELVRVIVEIGNHDDQSAIMLALCLANYYEREPRVEIDTSPAKYHWHRFGACLLGVTHGDTVKGDKLGPIMAVDRAQDWGETQHRAWYCGHVHHDSLKEYPGVTVESFRTLAARDAWHHAAGYRSARDMKLDVWHRRWGRIARHVVGINQLENR